MNLWIAPSAHQSIYPPIQQSIFGSSFVIPVEYASRWKLVLPSFPAEARTHRRRAPEKNGERRGFFATRAVSARHAAGAGVGHRGVVSELSVRAVRLA